jgi:hypothetical protein
VRFHSASTASRSSSASTDSSDSGRSGAAAARSSIRSNSRAMRAMVAGSKSSALYVQLPRMPAGLAPATITRSKETVPGSPFMGWKTTPSGSGAAPPAPPTSVKVSITWNTGG